MKGKALGRWGPKLKASHETGSRIYKLHTLTTRGHVQKRGHRMKNPRKRMPMQIQNSPQSLKMGIIAPPSPERDPSNYTNPS